MSGFIIDNDVLCDDVFRTNTSKLVWFCLLRASDNNGLVHISATSIAKEIGVSEKAVRNILVSLDNAHVIEKESPIFSPKKVRYKGSTIRLNIITSCNGKKQQQVRKKSDIQSDITLPKKQTKFIPPTDEDVAAYIAEKGYHFNPGQFVPHYQSKGWKVGNQPMKDWRAACRTWENSWKEKHGERFYYEIQPITTADTAACRKESRDRLRALATGVVSQSADKLFSLYNGAGQDPDDSRN